jgi:TMEM175 potassium channel family protein
MTPGRQRIGTPSEAVETSRLEIFADGVFGIAATLLIVRVSVDAPGGALGKALLHAWPQYVAYAVSFLMIGIWWVNHHAFMKVIERVDRTFLFANIALLACIAFIPFPTGLVAKHFHDDGLQAAVITHGLTLTATAICMSFLWFYAAIGRASACALGTTQRRCESRRAERGVPDLSRVGNVSLARSVVR